MRSTLSTVVALASVASATWTNAPSFSCPANTNNQCNSQQSSGFDWSSLNLGSFSSYGDFSFSGFTCASSFGSGKKRDIITGRTFQNKCITGKATSDYNTAPKFGCGSSPSVEKFSITEVQISVEFDCNLEFHYSMPGGSTCKQTSPCKSGGSIVKNTQCGGAKNVTVIYPTQQTGSGKGKSSCSIGMHSIGFDCSTASSTKTKSTTSSKPTSTSTKPATTKATTTSSSVPALSTSSSEKTEKTEKTTKTTSSAAEVTTTSSSSAETTSSEVVVKTTSSALFGNTTSTTSTKKEETTSSAVELTTSTTEAASTTQFTTSTIVSLITSTITSCGPEVTNCPAESTVLTTLTSIVSTTVCPVTETSTSSAVATTTSSSAVVTEVVSSSSEIATTTTSASGPVTTAPCPDVLPQCLNTWIFLEGCSSNADVDCFCPSAEVVSNVFACLSAYGVNDVEISAAQSYFQGICAAHIPSNPAIVTCASSVSSTVVQTIPVTTVQVYTTVVVPCTESTGVSAGFTIPSSSTTTVISTQVVVPQVVFQTLTGTSSAEPVLVTGAPASVNAGVTTVPVPASTTFAVTSKTNGTISATSTPTTVLSTGSAGQNSVAFGSIIAAALFAIMIL